MKVKRVQPDHQDYRGKIVRPISDLMKARIKNVSVIWSKAGVVRGNHYHSNEAHYEFVVDGEAEYYERRAGGTGRIRKVNLRPGDVIFTPKGQTHTLRFKKPTVLLYLSTAHRTRKGSIGGTTVDILIKPRR